jgi:hypothetical protein
MSLTLIATRSCPTVSCLFSWKASLSLVPTPSVPDTSTGSLYFLRQFEQRAKAADAGQHLGAHGTAGERLDAFDQGVPGFDIHAGVAVGKGALMRGLLGGLGCAQDFSSARAQRLCWRPLAQGLT